MAIPKLARLAGNRNELTAPFGLVLVISLIVSIGLVIIAAWGQDRVAVQASRHFARSILAGVERGLAKTAAEYGYWDQAVENLVTAFDPDWADVNIGAYLNENLEISSTFVLDANRQLLYGAINGERREEDPFKLYSGGLDLLVDRALAGPTNVPPTPATGFIRDEGSVHFAAVCRLTTYEMKDGRNIDQATDSVLILTKALDGGLLSRIAAEGHLEKSLSPGLIG
jgi:sensor domain CHASE-containing protein